MVRQRNEATREAELFILGVGVGVGKSQESRGDFLSSVGKGVVALSQHSC